MEMAPKFSPLPPTRPDRIKLLGDGRKYRGSTRCSREEKRAWIERGGGGGGGGGTRAVTIALERHDVVHVHTDDADRSVCIRGGGREGRESGRGEGGEGERMRGRRSGRMLRNILRLHRSSSTANVFELYVWACPRDPRTS